MKHIFTLLCTIAIFVSCTKELTPELQQDPAQQVLTAEELVELFSHYGIRMTEEEILDYMNSRSDECYSTIDLLGLLDEFGDRELDVIPFVPNSEFQDANCTVARWDADLAERDPEDSTTMSTSLEPINVVWILDEDPPVSTGASLRLPFYTYELGNCDTIHFINAMGYKAIELVNCDTLINPDCPGIFQPSCNGVHELTVMMEFESGLVVSRSGTGRGIVNMVPSEFPLCEGVEHDPSLLATFDFSTFSSIKFSPYQFVVQSSLQYDLNGDYVVNSADLVILLAGYGSC